MIRFHQSAMSLSLLNQSISDPQTHVRQTRVRNSPLCRTITWGCTLRERFSGGARGVRRPQHDFGGAWPGAANESQSVANAQLFSCRKVDAHRQSSWRLTDRTQNLSERNPDHLEADVKRLLLFCAISTSILTCLDKPAGLLFGEMEDGVG